MTRFATKESAQTTFTKTVVAAISACILTIMFVVQQTQAQNNRPEEFALNGLAAYQKLRKEYYVGALFLQKTSAGSMNFAGKKRMEMRVSIAKWTPRRFSREWRQAIFLNNDQELTNQFADQIQAFVDLPKNALLAGDQLVVVMDPKLGTAVYLNGTMAFAVADSAFFDILLNVWVGKRPPSSDFRNHILTLPSGQMGQDLLVRFQSATPTTARRHEVASWFKANAIAATEPKKVERTTAVTHASAAPVAKKNPATVKQRPRKATKPIAKTKKPPTTAKVKTKPPIVLKKPNRVNVAKPLVKEKAPALNTISNRAASTVALKKVAMKVESSNQAAAVKTDKVLSQQQLRDTYSAAVVKLTHLNVVYPKKALQRMQRGKVTLKVKINRNGDVTRVTEVISSRHSLLNRAAKTAVGKATPYPKPPRQLRGDSLELNVPFEFNL